MNNLKIFLLCQLFLLTSTHNLFAQQGTASNIFMDIPTEIQGEKLDAMVKTITMNAIIEQMSPEEILNMAWDDKLSQLGLSSDDVVIAAMATLLSSSRVTDYVIEKAVNDLLIPNELFLIAKEEALKQDDMAYTPATSSPAPLPIK
ncbi:MAG: hypothetical protein OEL87_02350 [Nanoarchaeota archaeon]|nr:hypothetical protein [Nanoarchaeota archaeon]